jgi:hypothetical protein
MWGGSAPEEFDQILSPAQRFGKEKQELALARPVRYGDTIRTRAEALVLIVD